MLIRVICGESLLSKPVSAGIRSEYSPISSKIDFAIAVILRYDLNFPYNSITLADYKAEGKSYFLM